MRMLSTGAGIAAFLAVLPWVLPGAFYVGIATHVLVFAMLALSLNILIGYGGMSSLGHAVYLGVPAYAYAWLTANAGLGPVSAAISAVALGTVLAAFFGVLALRLRAWFPDDHAGIGTDRLGPVLSVGRADRWR